MANQINKTKLKNLIKKLRVLVVPEVFEEEQKDIEERYGSPSREVSSNSDFEV